MYGPRGLSTEVRYIGRDPWRRGTGVRGSVLMDVVEGDPSNPVAIYDFKFGGARLTQSRIIHLRDLSGLQDVPIQEVKAIP